MRRAVRRVRFGLFERVSQRRCFFIKEALKSLLALILLAGFCELLLPEDGMRKYGRMVVGLIVLFFLVNLVMRVGQDFTLALPEVSVAGGRADPAALVAEGVNLRQRGEEQAAALTAPAVQAKVEELLQTITGTAGVQVEISTAAGQGQRVRVVLPADPGVPVEVLKRTVAAVLAMAPDQVEVKKEFAEEEGS
ncbi:stage III sporulation protein AF [Capillibacterium thermochitinicola]|uniref:stage III sporulation protein AF n=1 Tax=Capillibacterium thermochitinicola TaxID=2699427 RepID=UPI002F2B39C8